MKTELRTPEDARHAAEWLENDDINHEHPGYESLLDLACNMGFILERSVVQDVLRLLLMSLCQRNEFGIYIYF